MKIDILRHNSMSWDNEVEQKTEWTVPATCEQIEESRKGNIQIKITPVKSVPQEWIGNVSGKKILCLASGGGQQGPVLSAAGAEVTVLDNSPRQLQQDMETAERENLKIKTVLGDMRNLEIFSSESFNMIINPASIHFIEDVQPVWSECSRVLLKGGKLLTGAVNPLIYIFDYSDLQNRNKLIKYSIPHSDIDTFTDRQKKNYIKNKIPFEFGHSLEDVIKGQIDFGFSINGFYEDNNGGTSELDEYINTYYALLAVKN
ncbi:MAG: class I SAM-dependent methyltransferase [Spirochaetes bacterium]|nr:class I SAM-dependent methyltransferase [Spirochaetota bacterium]